MFPGVLLLSGSIGKHVNEKRINYRCIPADKSKDEIRLPYTVKSSFSKNLKNRYILYNENIITENIGEVDNYEAYVKYELALIGWKSNRNMRAYLVSSPEFSKYKEEEFVFTIDNMSTQDFDDAVSIQRISGVYVLRIYISNIGRNESLLKCLPLISSVSSIYLPDKVYPMLIEGLSNRILSLKEGTVRECICLELHVSAEGDIVSRNFSSKQVKICKNYVYESQELLSSQHYIMLQECVAVMNQNNIYIHNNEELDSHDIVQYTMLLINYYASLEIKDPIYRCATKSSNSTNSSILSFLGSSANYTLEPQSHAILGLSSYVHISSPIRRLVDIINIMTLDAQICKHEYGEEVWSWINGWKSNIETINSKMKAIRKMQNRVSLLSRLSDTETEALGYVFDEKEKDSIYKYTAYIPAYSVFLPMKSTFALEENREYKFKIFVIMEEWNVKKKIRLEIITE